MFKDKFGEYSIVTTVFNDQETISSLLKNIENQTYYPKEIIIVQRIIQCKLLISISKNPY